MKKLLILVTLIALVAGGMVFAQAAAPAAPTFPAFTLGGQVYYGAMSNFKDVPGMFVDNRVMFTDALDANTSVVFRLRAKNAFNGWRTPALTDMYNGQDPSYGFSQSNSSQYPNIPLPIRLDRAYAQSNVTGLFGVDPAVAKVVLYGGFYNMGTADLSNGISPWEVADISGKGWDVGGYRIPGFGFVATFANMVNVRAFGTPTQWSQTQLTYLYDNTSFNTGNGTGYTVSVDGTMGPISLMVAYARHLSKEGGWELDLRGTDWSEDMIGTPAVGTVIHKAGKFNVSAKYANTMDQLFVALVPQVTYNFDAPQPKKLFEDGEFKAGQLQIALAGQVKYGTLVNLQLGYLGYTDYYAYRLETALTVTPVPFLGIQIAPVFNLNTTDKNIYIYQFPAMDTRGTAPTPIDTRIYAGKDNLVNEMDINAFLYVGKAKWQVGYYYLPTGNYPTARDDIGLTGCKGGQPRQGGVYFETYVMF